MNFGRALQSVDAFRQVSKDLTRGSATGGVFTAVAYALLIVLIFAEFSSFMRTTFATNIVMDENTEKLIQINFDISLYDLPCNFLKIAVFDKFGQEKINSTDQFKYQSLDHVGSDKGHAYSSDEIVVLEQEDALSDMTDEEQAELDADWASSSDHFKHQDFKAAITVHEYTFMNFYAEWCIHCRQFHPTWMGIVNKMSEKTEFTDGDSNKVTVKFLKMNCVDFEETCREARISSFPSLRLYKRDGSFDQYQEHRAEESIVSYLTRTIQNSHRIVSQHHSMFTEGCRVSGQLRVPRIQGHFYLQAEPHGNVQVNPALTNVSHTVNHFSFGDDSEQGTSIVRNMILDLFIKHTNPLDGKSFVVQHFHEAPQHYLKVVSTHMEGQRDMFYQITHSDRIRKLHKGRGTNYAAPQARFAYDFSPMSVVVRRKSKRWYEFLTSLFAILGGTYTVIELTSGAVDTVHASIKEALGKAN